MGALTLADRMRAYLAKQTLEYQGKQPATPPVSAWRRPPILTVITSGDLLLQQADAALYDARNGGRN